MDAELWIAAIALGLTLVTTLGYTQWHIHKTIKEGDEKIRAEASEEATKLWNFTSKETNKLHGRISSMKDQYVPKEDFRLLQDQITKGFQDMRTEVRSQHSDTNKRIDKVLHNSISQEPLVQQS